MYKIVLQFIRRVLRNVQYYQPFRPLCRYLAAKLGSYRTASARYQHHLAAHEFIHALVVKLYRFAAQQILYLHFPHAGRKALFAGSIALNLRNRIAQYMHAAARVCAYVQYFAFSFGRGVVYCQYYVRNGRVCKQLNRVVDRPYNAHAVYALALLFARIVNKAIRLICAVHVVVQLSKQCHARAARAYYGGVALRARAYACHPAPVFAI